MKQENILKVTINAPVEDVFTYTVDPSNTPEWIDEVAQEEASPWPPQVGITKYRNHGGSLDWTNYTLSAYIPNEVFELTRADGIFKVRYTYITLQDGRTELTYHEWVTEGRIEYPFQQPAMDKLKSLFENE